MIVVSLACLFEALSVIYCLHYLYGEKIRLDIATWVLVVFDMILMNTIYFMNLNQAWTMIIYPIIVLYCGLKFGFNLKTILVNNIIYMVILSGIQTTIMVLISALFKIQRMEPQVNMLINAAMFCIVILVLKRCKLNKLSVVLQSHEKVVLNSLVVVIVSIMLFLLNYKRSGQFEIFYYVVLGASIILIVVAAIDIGKHKMKAKEAEAELRLHKLYEESFRELIDEICARQHEFDNHINAIYSQHRLYKTYDELVKAQRKYCDDVMEENEFNKILSKGNPVILCFLYSKFLEMKRKEITVTYQINIGDLECGMPIHKMVELLGNLIKNAVEEVQERKGKIHVLLLEEYDKIQLEVSNESCVIEEKKIKDFFKKGYSQKGKHRGYGLYNVEKICEEYGAAIICKNEEMEGMNWLRFKLTINKPL